MFITKLKVNLFHKPAIYVYLTFKLVLNAISPVSRLESEYVYNYDCKFLQATCRSILQHCIAILQHCIAILQYCSQKNIRFWSKNIVFLMTLRSFYDIFRESTVFTCHLNFIGLGIISSIKYCRSPYSFRSFSFF